MSVLGDQREITAEQKKCIKDAIGKIVADNPQLDWWWEDIRATHDRLVTAAEKCQSAPTEDEQK